MKNNIPAPVPNNSTSATRTGADLAAHARALRQIYDDIARAPELDHVKKVVAEAISQIEIATIRRDYPQLRAVRNWRFEPRKY